MIKTITKHMNSTDVIAEIYDTIRVGDYGAYVLNLVLDDLESISGDVRLRFERSDGQIILTAPVTVSGNTIIHELTASEIAVVSPLNMWVQFSESNLYTPIQIVFDQVLAVPSGTPIPDTDEYPEYLAAIEAAEDAADSANSAATAANSAADLANTAAAEAQEIVDLLESGGLVKTDQSTPQTFINGVPKIANAPTDKLDATNKEYVDKYALGGSGFNANLYFTTINSDVSGYRKLSYIAEATQTELSIAATTAEQLVRTYLFDSGLGVTVIDGGKWSATYRARVSASQGATLRFEAFLRHTDGTETTLFSQPSDKIVNTAYATLETQVTQPSFNCVSTDRLGVRLYASTTHPAGVTLYTIVGDGNASYINTPLAIRHAQLRDKNGEADFQHMTAAEKTAVDSIGTTVSGAISEHNNDAGAHASLFAAVMADIALRHALHYTFRWDKVNALGVRLNSLANIGTNIASYCHLGTLNTTLSNPFNSIYPWSDRNNCNISIDAYRALSSGASLRDCIISWLGDPDFDYAHTNGAWVYTPEFWYKVWDEGGYRYFDISPIAITGYIHAPETIEGRWYGGIYALTVDGTSKSCLLPKPGMPGKNVALSTLHTYAKNWGASIENIYGYSATDVLMIVEFATMNTQNAIGNGVSDLYRQGGYTIKANATASATVKILTADASTYCIPGAIFDIGATDGSAGVGSYIIASTALDADPTYTIVTLTTDGSTPASVTATTANFWSVHGLSNTVDASIGGGSGYIGTNGKSHAYYRGQVAHANLFRYILGAYRQTGTGEIWIANSQAEADTYDALNTAAHKDTGLPLPQGAAGAATDGYISALLLCPDVPAAPFCESIGGSSANPVGDYCYVPALATENTILVAGGYARNGASCGRFFGYWFSSAATSAWFYGAVPVLKTPI